MHQSNRFEYKPRSTDRATLPLARKARRALRATVAPLDVSAFFGQIRWTRTRRINRCPNPLCLLAWGGQVTGRYRSAKSVWGQGSPSEYGCRSGCSSKVRGECLAGDLLVDARNCPCWPNAGGSTSPLAEGAHRQATTYNPVSLAAWLTEASPGMEAPEAKSFSASTTTETGHVV